MSLLSMTKLMKEGYAIVAEGAYCLAVSPSKLIYRFKIAASGLLAFNSDRSSQGTLYSLRYL